MWEVLATLAKLGTSVVLTTHYMEEAARLAQRVVVIAGGRVVGEGTPELLARELQLGTMIRATLPAEVVVTDLPPEARDGLLADGRFELRVNEPAPVLAALCGWAVERGIDLADLDVRAPSLEESYLALTDTSATAAAETPQEAHA
jgi:ABC-2 type transport system ATP-binding protein